ncbi:MAG: efflux RND transporter permease subunit [Rhodothalassiaceae bacterium]
MSLTSHSLKNPAAVAVMVTIAVLLGLLSLTRLPVQLFPNIERPVLGVQAGWRAASPREIEAELVEPIEDVLQGVPGLLLMQSWSNSGGAWINLQFALNTDMDKAFAEVSSRLQRIRTLPADADRPRVISNGGGDAGQTLIYLFTQQLGSNTAAVDYESLVDTINELVVPELEALQQVASVQVNSDAGERILRVVFDPYRAAQLGIDIDAMAQRIGRANDVSGGTVTVGRRDFALRFEGRYRVDELEDLILDWRGETPIRLADIAEIELAPNDFGAVTIQNGNPAIGLEVKRASGANVLAGIAAVTEVIDDLNQSVLAEQGVTIRKSFDPSVFILRAIAMLTNNLLVGALLAVGALWWFLRQMRATLLIATTIPICMMATFLVLNLFGRSVNVISLAGLAFATGMVLDAAIVVLENIVRLREQGRRPDEAAALGAKQVWGALLASTATTVAIFVPIIFMKDVEGQLFADLALTIAIAVSVSLIVAVTVLPTAARRFFKPARPRPQAERWWTGIAALLMRATGTRLRAAAWVAVLIAGPVALTWALLPQINYLPPVKRDAVDAFINFPSGSTAETMRREFADVVVERLQPYMDGSKQPELKNYYLFTGPWGGNIGVRAKDQSRVKELEDIVCNQVLTGFPDVRSFCQQGNLFGGFGGGGAISVYLQSADPVALADAAAAGQELIAAALPGTQARPNPDPQVVAPEIRVTPNDRRIAEMGLTRDAVARTIRALGDGLWLGEYFYGDRRVDMILRAGEWDAPEYLESVPVATPDGGVVPLGDLVTIRRDVGPSNIQRVDGRRTITLQVNPPEGMALQTAIETLKREVEPELRRLLPADGVLAYGGDASALNRALITLGSNFGVAVVLLFLIMAALFQSVRDAAIVVVALPMATVGGVLALQLLNTVSFAPLDLLGMIGFIILLGLVVNNAILLVVETRRSEAEGLARKDAVHQALRLRLRPILMSTLTSIAGMLPLVLIPGAGSLIYRGMAAVIVGGMSVSTLFTLILLPSLLQLTAPRQPAPQLAPAE